MGLIGSGSFPGTHHADGVNEDLVFFRDDRLLCVADGMSEGRGSVIPAEVQSHIERALLPALDQTSGMWQASDDRRFMHTLSGFVDSLNRRMTNIGSKASFVMVVRGKPGSPCFYVYSIGDVCCYLASAALKSWVPVNWPEAAREEHRGGTGAVQRFLGMNNMPGLDACCSLVASPTYCDADVIRRFAQQNRFYLLEQGSAFVLASDGVWNGFRDPARFREEIAKTVGEHTAIDAAVRSLTERVRNSSASGGDDCSLAVWVSGEESDFRRPFESDRIHQGLGRFCSSARKLPIVSAAHSAHGESIRLAGDAESIGAEIKDAWRIYDLAREEPSPVKNVALLTASLAGDALVREGERQNLQEELRAARAEPEESRKKSQQRDNMVYDFALAVRAVQQREKTSAVGQTRTTHGRRLLEEIESLKAGAAQSGEQGNYAQDLDLAERATADTIVSAEADKARTEIGRRVLENIEGFKNKILNAEADLDFVGKGISARRGIQEKVMSSQKGRDIIKVMNRLLADYKTATTRLQKGRPEQPEQAEEPVALEPVLPLPRVPRKKSYGVVVGLSCLAAGLIVGFVFAFLIGAAKQRELRAERENLFGTLQTFYNFASKVSDKAEAAHTLTPITKGFEFKTDSAAKFAGQLASIEKGLPGKPLPQVTDRDYVCDTLLVFYQFAGNIAGEIGAKPKLPAITKEAKFTGASAGSFRAALARLRGGVHKKVNLPRPGTGKEKHMLATLKAFRGFADAIRMEIKPTLLLSEIKTAADIKDGSSKLFSGQLETIRKDFIAWKKAPPKPSPAAVDTVANAKAQAYDGLITGMKTVLKSLQKPESLGSNFSAASAVRKDKCGLPALLTAVNKASSETADPATLPKSICNTIEQLARLVGDVKAKEKEIRALEENNRRLTEEKKALEDQAKRPVTGEGLAARVALAWQESKDTIAEQDRAVAEEGLLMYLGRKLHRRKGAQSEKARQWTTSRKKKAVLDSILDKTKITLE